MNYNDFSPFLQILFFSALSSEYLLTNARKDSEWFLSTLVPSFIPKIVRNYSFAAAKLKPVICLFSLANTCLIIWTETINGLVVHRLVLVFFFFISTQHKHINDDVDSTHHKYACMYGALVCCWQREKQTTSPFW